MKPQILAAGAILALASAALASAPAFASESVITYSNFNSTAGLNVTGEATTSSGALVLTPQAQFQSGAALTNVALAMGSSPSFDTSFQFQFNTASGIASANGFAFVLTSNAAGVGASNQTLGLTTAPSLAVEFSDYGNSHLNPAIGNKLYNSNLVAAIVNGNTVVAGNPTGSYASPGGVTSCVHPGSGTNCMNNGTVWTADISYAKGLLNVSLRDAATGQFMNVITNYAIALGADVYAGFSGSTGSAYQSADILNWTMNYNNVPEPAALGLLGTGIAALAFTRKRRRAV